MDSTRHLFVGLLLFVFSGVAQNCTYVSSNGKYSYNLSGMTLAGSDFSNSDGGTGTIFINICAPSTKAIFCGTDTASCLFHVNAYSNFGSTLGLSFSDLGSGGSQGVTLTYPNGGICGGGTRQTIINIYCQQGTAPGTITNSYNPNDIAQCVFNVNMASQFACPTIRSGGISGGTIFLIALLSVTVVYFGAGIGIQRYRGRSGVELIPNVVFWKSFFNLVSLGCRFVFYKFYIAIGKDGSAYKPIDNPTL